MKLVVKWNKEEWANFFKELKEVRETYQLTDSLVVEFEEDKITSLVLEEPEINFIDTLVEGKALTKEQIQELLEQLFDLWKASACGPSGCSSCSSGC